ncbi:MAG: hypothetical protein GY773_01610, partial [Actinomycetia bacterium]|nr:hypothetical protein [Actinomycetes bacterium]
AVWPAWRRWAAVCGKGVEIQGVKMTVNVQEFYGRLAEAASAGGENG